MRHRILKLFVTSFCLLYALSGFAQTTPQSEHPLLDKYYPRKQADTVKNSTTQINQQPVTKPVVEAKTMPATKPVTLPAPVIPAPAPEPVVEKKPVAIMPDTTATAKLQDTNKPLNVSKPAVTAITAPAPAKAPQATGTPYNSSQLGSSTPRYDTWEKNNNGAGSVTTSPK